jgi:aryl-alcohol dehydrogenase-like predicted oxidoreductase
VRDQREQPLGRGVLPAPRDTKLAEQAREISRRQHLTERAEALVERQEQVAAALGTALTDEPS